MADFIRPKVVVSKCIEFDYCRWNGNIIRSPVVEILKKYVDFSPICAEFEIGLGVPRDPIRIILENDVKKLMQPSTGRDLTELMHSFSNKYLNSLEGIDGFILKSQSPSCGLYQTKYLTGIHKGASKAGIGPGFFGGAVLKLFPDLAIETEGRLKNFSIREYFMTKLYALASFKEVKQSNSMYDLVRFHTINKFLFMSYDQSELHKLGRIVANKDRICFDNIIEDYEKSLANLFQKPPKFTNNINVLMHSLGYFKENLSHAEKAFFLDNLEKYRIGWIPLFVMINLVKSWIVRFNQHYLEEQSFFNPYPEEIMTFDIKDTWRGRDYWKQS